MSSFDVSSIFLFKGKHLEATTNGSHILVNWNDCFTSLRQLIYEVSVGTTQGGADVIQWQETLNDYIEIQLPGKLTDQTDVKLYFYIQAIGDNGKESSVQMNMNI